MTLPTRIWTELDFHAEGKQEGYLRLPISNDDSGGGFIPIPAISVKNGPGPRLLLQAGNHGDEFEGQIMLMKFARRVKAEDIAGQLFILPGINAPAVEAGRRTSPVDGANLNRVFPGLADGTPTSMIAHFLTTEMLPRVTHVLDFHSGGRSMEFMPSAHIFRPDDPVKYAEGLRILRTFGMPKSLIMEGRTGHEQKFTTVCQNAGVLHMSTELGGGGRVSLPALRAAEKGLVRVLKDLGALKADWDAEPAPTTTFYRRQNHRKNVFATARGIFEPFFDLGEWVEAGQPACAIHFSETPWRAPEVLTFKESGIVLAKRAIARVQIGDGLLIVGQPLDDAEICLALA
ncbi:succinylglutamate desuccinylase/aspartoacylase family protein [Mesorhizobium sp.]|uniref:succinylglutamate desuccinylase/aspartoacylase family protein n=1 Tax=Mesorhizobium sp. TaxID=1871066 RepID=UPI000FE922F6|nr:succinylglutamate desuccinylase/aspartoacylase family protein [Mesorhizobium sp.]RWD42781.1 MAG: deacylase [Mesorhizobium sp.]